MKARNEEDDEKLNGDGKDGSRNPPHAAKCYLTPFLGPYSHRYVQTALCNQQYEG